VIAGLFWALACKQEPRALTPREAAAELAARAKVPVELDDGDGLYQPREPIIIGTDTITGFSLFPPGFVVPSNRSGGERPFDCSERVATQDTLHLRCVSPVLGTVTIDGHFLVRRGSNLIYVTRDQDVVVDAMVTVRRAGKTLYAKRQHFTWLGGD
jgi:hypothetical protein